MTWEQRENIFAKESLSIDDIQELYGLQSRAAASEFLRSIKRKLRIDGKDLIFDLPGKIHRLDYLSWTGADETQYGRKETARKYIAETFDFTHSTENRIYTYNPLMGDT